MAAARRTLAARAAGQAPALAPAAAVVAVAVMRPPLAADGWAAAARRLQLHRAAKPDDLCRWMAVVAALLQKFWLPHPAPPGRGRQQPAAGLEPQPGGPRRRHHHERMLGLAPAAASAPSRHTGQCAASCCCRHQQRHTLAAAAAASEPLAPGLLLGRRPWPRLPRPPALLPAGPGGVGGGPPGGHPGRPPSQVPRSGLNNLQP